MFTRRAAFRVGVAAVVAAVGLVAVAPAGAADGDLDPAFDGDGKVVADFGFEDAGRAVAVQPDGRVVVAGNSCNGDFLVARYLPGGAPDPAFNGTGAVCVGIGDGTDDRADDVLALPDGRLLVAGTSDGDFAAVRLTSAGALDPTFGTGGRATYDLGGDEVLRDADLAPDGKIVLTGETTGPGCPSAPTMAGTTWGAAVVRTSADGALDAGFGTGGKAVDISAEYDLRRGFAAAVQPDGAIVVAGRYATCTRVNIHSLVYRLTPAGVPDPSFSAPGVDQPYTDTASDVLVQPDGRILVLVDTFGGPVVGTANDDAMTVVRLLPGGGLDSGFGSGGVATALFGAGGDATSAALAVQSDRIVVAGAFEGDSAVARFTPAGLADESFDGDGRLVVDLGGIDHLDDVAVQADGKLVVAGQSGADVALARIGTVPPPPPPPPPRPRPRRPRRPR